MVPTKQGVIDNEIVEKYREAHQEAVKEQGYNVAGGESD